ncbi:OmpA family protein [Pedobacter sp. SL55]|uniref:OmpA family protein n=1 Tax=Pedobacter sp. SL55 TaxID=2995161 RepID=UPI00226DC866|nr:OmpA family protein [Pedobacter sp. SL55]WAC42527.1 OmpA family protein [Pedobacter sp. SL55]
MKRNIIIAISLLSTLLLTNLKVSAQYVLKEADAQFELFNFEKAAQLYTEAYQKKKTLKATQGLAESYRLMRDFKQAASWYAILVETEGAKIDAFKWYAEMLRNNGKYSEAKEQYTKYGQLLKNPTQEELLQVSNWKKSCDSAVKWMRNPKQITINNEKTLNSAQSDWAPVVYNNGLVFTSDRTDAQAQKVNTARPFLKFDTGKKPDRNTYGWTGNDYLRVYQQASGSDAFSLFPLKTSSDYHVASTSFSADENEVYFTLTRIPKDIERVKGMPSTINIEIYSSRKNGDTWSEPEAFRYNNIQEWSVGDPFLSQDGKLLFFVSNKPGGKGGTDIYFCERTSDGKWGAAENLMAVNSVGNERSPVMHDGYLYFSTDNGIGMGGLDIHRAKIVNGGLVSMENMGYPINSPQDDFTFRPTGKLKGYFASNRDGGMGQDDIYSFIEQEKLKFLVQGRVFNKETNVPLSNAVVTLKKTNGTPVMVQTDDDGGFKFNLDENTDYDLLADKTNFRSDKANITTKGLTSSKPIEQNLYLTAIVRNKPIRIENIFYDFDKSNIRKDAAVELDKLVAIMKENPTIWIELGSHTDSRGNDQYNQWLSQSRANSAVQYIIDRGIDKSRITAKGYGESVPVNKCTNGVKCSEADHQLNRRTEFKIVKQ